MAVEQNILNPFGSSEAFGFSDGRWSLGGGGGSGANGGGDNGGGTPTTKRFVAIQENPGHVAWSDNGISWTGSTTKPSGNLLDVAYGDGMFVTVGSNNSFAYSLDGGENWTDVTISSEYANQAWTSVTYGNGMFVAVGQDNYKMQMAYSEDGINWSFKYTYGDGPFSGYIINEVGFGNGHFIVSRSNSYQIWTSPDLITWTLHSYSSFNPSEQFMGTSSFASDGINIIGVSPSTVVTKYSPAAGVITGSSIVNRNWQGLAYGASKYVAVGNDTPFVAYSANGGQSWTEISTPLSDVGVFAWQDVAFGNNKFVALSFFGQVAVSSDGISWTEPATNIPNSVSSNGTWRDIAYGEWSE